MSVRFAELLARTNFSFLEGASHPDEMVGAAKERGLAAIGIADRDGVYGIVKAHMAAKEAKLPLVIGARMTIAGLAGPLVLLAKDGPGYAALCTLITKGRMRNPKGVCSVTLEEAASCAIGCWAIATGLPRENAASETGRLREVFGERLSIAIAR